MCIYTGFIYMTEQSTQQKQNSKRCELISSVFPDVPQLSRLFRNRMVWLDDENNWICDALILFLSSFLPPFLLPSFLFYVGSVSSSLSSKSEIKSLCSYTSIKYINNIHWGGRSRKSLTAGTSEETELHVGNTGMLGSRQKHLQQTRSIPPWTPWRLFFSELSHLLLICYNCLEKRLSIWIFEELSSGVYPWNSKDISFKSLIDIPLDSLGKRTGEAIPSAARSLPLCTLAELLQTTELLLDPCPFS